MSNVLNCTLSLFFQADLSFDMSGSGTEEGKVCFKLN